LLKAGAKTNIMNKVYYFYWNKFNLFQIKNKFLEWQTPLYLASEKGHEKTVLELLKASAKINITNEVLFIIIIF